MMWMRVAMGLAINEKEKEKRALEFYEVLSTLRFVSSTPTLFHSGTPHAQLSSCYLNTVEDDLEHIFKVYGDNAQLSKWAGGVGTDWTNVRATGAYVKKADLESQGVVPFLKIANDVTVAINRSGRRRGATAVYLETWHMDIYDFLELRKNTGDERRRTHDMNTANWVPDLFMKRIREDKDWTLFSPDETPELHHIYGKAFEEKYEDYEKLAEEGKLILTKKVKARDLWKKMLAMLYETGHPWITFKDPSNIRSPQDHVGVVHNSNLCTEITLNTSKDETAVCNLGSVNLAMHMKGGKLNAELIENTVKTGMRMLDNVVDINFYPIEEAKNSNMKHRPVGLGLMGFQDALYMMGINFDSEECIKFADQSMETIAYYAILSSSELAKEKGTYESYKGSKWDRGLLPQDTVKLLEEERGEKIDVSKTETMDWKKVRDHVKEHGMRNSNCMSVAPTATISNICGAIPAIEPIYKNIYVKSNISGDFTIVNSYLIEDLKKLNMWDYEMLGKLKYQDGSIQNITEIPQALKEKYKETFEINPKWLIKAAAYRGKWIDQSQSVNIFFRGSSGKEISDIYFYAWEMGLKTTYYLRTLAASQVEKSTVNTAEHGSTHIRSQDTQVVSVKMEEEKKPEYKAKFAVYNEKKAEGDKGKTDEPKLCKILDPDCEACQ
jgi:ribonucleoside-diphosphate reductase alpha chain